MDKSLETVKKKLLELGFFKYCDDLEGAINDVFKNYENDGKIQWTLKLQGRVFSIDYQDIGQLEGMVNFVGKELKPILERRGVFLDVKNHIESFIDDGHFTKRAITINGKIYNVLGKSEFIGHYDSAFRAGIELAEILFDESQLEEKVYGLYFDYSGLFFIADQKLFEYLRELIPESKDVLKPFIIEEYFEKVKTNFEMFRSKVKGLLRKNNI